MNTNDPIFLDALNELYAALMKVMRLANPQMVTPDKMLGIIASALAPYASGEYVAPAPAAGAAQAYAPAQADAAPAADAPAPKAEEPAKPAGPDDSYETWMTTSPEMRPTDDKWGFRNADLCEPSEDSSDNHYVVRLKDEDAYFELKSDAMAHILFNREGIIPSEVVKVQGTPDRDAKIINIEPGHMTSQGRWWIIDKPLTVKFAK